MSVPKPLVLAVGALLAVIAVFGITLVVGAGTRTSWRLAGPASGTEVKIGVYVGGCDRFDRISVREYDEFVVIDAYIRRGERNNCNDIFNIEDKTVQLSAPIGSRELRGCNPQSSVYKSSASPNRDCAAETAINESPAMRDLIEVLDGLVAASYNPLSQWHASSYGIGIREADDDEVYIQLELGGMDVTALRDEIPDEIAGYEVKVITTSTR